MGRLVKTGLLTLALVLSMSVASAAGPAPADLKNLRLAHIDPPIKAPELRLMDLNRREVALAEFSGRGVLVYFWASW